MLLFAMSAFVACSDDDDVNTLESTVGFADTETTVSEAISGGYAQIPINVSGRRNGPVNVTITTEPVGENPAVEGEHYFITDKTLNLNADDEENGVINVELKVIDDQEINENRQFKMIIASANGAEITTQEILVTLKDNDGNFYEAFAGRWTLTAISVANRTTVTKDVIITAAEEGSADYERYLTMESTNLFGVNESSKIRLEYNFDLETKSGTLFFICDENIGTWNGYNLLLYPFDGQYLYNGNYGTVWQLAEDGKLPNKITFDPSLMDNLYLAGFAESGGNIAGFLDVFTNITLTKK